MNEVYNCLWQGEIIKNTGKNCCGGWRYYSTKPNADILLLLLGKGHAYVRYYALHLKDIQRNNYFMKVKKRLLIILIHGDTSAKEDSAA